jgi:hypothetical protein
MGILTGKIWYHCIGGWVGRSPFWTGAENLAPVGFDLLTVQPVASRYTD